MSDKKFRCIRCGENPAIIRGVDAQGKPLRGPYCEDCRREYMEENKPKP